jgi:hypothetical protein
MAVVTINSRLKTGFARLRLLIWHHLDCALHEDYLMA